jgi:DNA-3-methyladenine glycosylase II
MSSKSIKTEARLNTRSFTVKAVTPFNFDLSAAIFSRGDPQFTAYDGESFMQVLRIGPKLALCTVSPVGTVDEPALRVKLESDQVLFPADARRARASINRNFNLDMDLKPFYLAIKGDPNLNPSGQGQGQSC